MNFWTLTCINWLRQEPYVRAWSRAYRERRGSSSSASTRRILLRTRDRRNPAGDGARSTTQSQSTTTTCGARSTTTTGRRSTSSTPKASSASTWRRRFTRNPSASSSDCSACSASSSPSKGAASRRQPTGITSRHQTYLGYGRSERFASADTVPRQAPTPTTKAVARQPLGARQQLVIGRENVVARGPRTVRARRTSRAIRRSATSASAYALTVRLQCSRRRHRRGERRAPARPHTPTRHGSARRHFQIDAVPKAYWFTFGSDGVDISDDDFCLRRECCPGWRCTAASSARVWEPLAWFVGQSWHGQPLLSHALRLGSPVDAGPDVRLRGRGVRVAPAAAPGAPRRGVECPADAGGPCARCWKHCTAPSGTEPSARRGRAAPATRISRLLRCKRGMNTQIHFRNQTDRPRVEKPSASDVSGDN